MAPFFRTGSFGICFCILTDARLAIARFWMQTTHPVVHASGFMTRLNAMAGAPRLFTAVWIVVGHLVQVEILN